MVGEAGAPEGVFTHPPIERVLYGPGRVSTLAEEAGRLGARRVFVITGRSLATKTEIVRRVEGLLGERHAGTFAEIGQHAPSEGVAAAVRAAREAGADALVSVGGGSPIDAAKLVALALAEGWSDATELTANATRAARPDPSVPIPPHVAIGTTLSAAEFTGAAGVTDERTRYKGGHRHPGMTPRVVILDPELTLETPWGLWVASGIKALDHAVERMIVPAHTPFTDALCTEAIHLLMEHLPRSQAGVRDAVARRGQCQVAGWLSMYGFPAVSGGLSHALGHQIGAYCGVPHGVTSCITLAPVVRHIGRTAPHTLAPVARALGVSTASPDVGEQVADQIAGLVSSLGVPTTLHEAGVTDEQIEALVAATVHELRGRGLASADEIRALLRAAA